MLAFLERRRVSTLDITGGAPELNAQFRRLVSAARDMGVRVMDRCNLTVLEVPGQEDLAEFLAAQQVEIVASMPCYLEDNVDRQRGKGVFDASLRGLRRLNALGYGRDGSGLVLDLVYNPQGPSLPPRAGRARDRLQARARRALRHRVQPPLHARQHADPALRRDPDRQGRVRALPRPAAARAPRRQPRRRDVPQPDLGRLARLSSTTATSTRCSICRLCATRRERTHLSELLDADLAGRPIRVAGHCYGCTAGQGSSCGGALKEAAE